MNTHIVRLTSVVLLLAACGSRLVAADPIELSFEIDAGDVERVNAPVCVPIKLKVKPVDANAAVVRDGDVRLPAQVTRPSLDAKHADANAELHFIVPKLAAGEKHSYRARIFTDRSPRRQLTQFQWHDTAGKHSDLTFGDRPVLRYMYERLDNSTAARRDATIKPYHHVFDPEGDSIITKPHGGLYTHHRGLFFGFNKISYGDGKRADVWHCRHGESQQHVAELAQEAGPVLGRHRVKIEWRGEKNDVFATEEREVTAYNTPGGLLIDFASHVETADGPVKLDGDPQHAGFHFRASNEVNEKTKSQTYYLRPDGRGQAGETRNWPDNKQHVNLPWNAMSFVLGDQRFTVLYLDKPTNPKEARFSERDYGRFGSYFEYNLTKDNPLDVNYRVWVQRGELSGEAAAHRDRQFDNPVKITVQQ
jgi:hypothetical protein